MFYTLKNGLKIEVKQPEPSDCESLVEMMKKTYEESEFLTRNPDEFNITVEDEIRWISKFDHLKNTMIIVKDGDKVIANTNIHGVGVGTEKIKHRCTFGIAVLKDYHRMGIGQILITEMKNFAKKAGYKQIELEVVARNYGAIQLYLKNGFEVYGKRPAAFIQRDGREDAEYLMICQLGE